MAQRSRGGGGGGGDPLGGGFAAQSHGEEIVVIIFFYLVGQPIQHPPPVSLPSPMQLASSIVDVRCQRSSSSFSSSSRFVAVSKLHVALLVESFVHMMQASKRFPALLRTRHPSQLIRCHRRVRPSSSSLAPTPLAMRMDLAANMTAESSLTSSSRIRRLTHLQILLRNLQSSPPAAPSSPPSSPRSQAALRSAPLPRPFAIRI